MVPDNLEGIYSYQQILSSTVSIDLLEIFQSHENYTTRRKRNVRFGKENRLILFFSIEQAARDIYWRLATILSANFTNCRWTDKKYLFANWENQWETNEKRNGRDEFHSFQIVLDAICIGAAMTELRLAFACAQRGYIRIYSVAMNELEEISPKDILHTDPPIKSLTSSETASLFITLNFAEEIIVRRWIEFKRFFMSNFFQFWTRNNEAMRKFRFDVSLISIANLNDRGDILLVSNRRL